MTARDESESYAGAVRPAAPGGSARRRSHPCRAGGFHRLWWPVVGVAVLMLAACQPGARAEERMEPVETTRVDMPRHYRFAPAAIRVPAGTTVTWRNSDDFTHSVRIEGGDGAVHTVAPGDSIRIPFNEPGEHRYVCTFHPYDMTGVVIVTPPAAAAP